MIPFDIVEKIQLQVNNTICYESDIQQYNLPEWWTPAIFAGDCEDYALLKRKLLLDIGFSVNDVHLVTCWTETNEYHCVLMVNTNRGYYILDNRYATIYKPNYVNYKWEKVLTNDGWRELSFE